MRMSNIVMLGIALVCAAAAALLSRAWLVSQSAQPAIEATASLPSRSVVVAARDFKYGDKLGPDAVKSVSWPSDTMPKGAYQSVEAFLGSAKDRTALTTILQGEPVLEHKLLGAASSSALSAKLTENMKAVTIRVNDVAGVAGFVQPDDRVDVFLTYGIQGANETTPLKDSSVVVLLQNIRVLAVDQTIQRKDQPTPAKAVTLEATTEEAQKLILAGRVGELSLALNRIAANGADQPTGTIGLKICWRRSGA
ncbi:MAG: Flp pilus assembly protein CpaB [Rhodomicrobium sp.]|nr:Flp pilus assembly protein CpaB [Rhodomicrobium sp.]